MKTTKEIMLPNGLTLQFVNHARRYFGDYHEVTVEAVCDVPVPSGHEAAHLLGTKVTYRRSMTKMGVPTSGIDETLDQLIEAFRVNALSYLSSPLFSEKFLRSEALKREKKRSCINSTPRF